MNDIDSNTTRRPELGRKVSSSYNTSLKSLIGTSFSTPRNSVYLREVDNFKRRFVSRLFWGRSNYYKNVTQIIVISITLFITLTGVILRISNITTSQSVSLKVGASILGTDDLLQQGGSIDTVLLSSADNVLSVKWNTHTVREGESLDAIAEHYNISKKTIQSANSKEYPRLFLGDQIQEGWEIQIPDINGVIHEVHAGEDIEKIVQKYVKEGNTEANRFNIIEFNALEEPYELKIGQLLFIPDGNTANTLNTSHLDFDALVGAFVDPLSNPNCNGYTYSRGFTSYHNGVDLAKWDGCPVVSIADGVVEYAGYANGGQGNMVRIDHGGGIKTEYFHGNGVFYVRPGDFVEQHQEIMFMGSTGYSTGTHVHVILWKDGIAIDPQPFVPYKI